MLARKTIEILRTVLVAALPLGAVLVGQAVLHFSTGVFRWTSIATGVWALLYVVISLDPAIRDKMDTARSLVDTLYQARRIGLSDLLPHRPYQPAQPQVSLTNLRALPSSIPSSLQCLVCPTWTLSVLPLRPAKLPHTGSPSGHAY
jgi:hypothetical protein